MNCIICLEDVVGLETRADEVWCNNHAAHTDCLFQWCQNQKISISSTKCICCNTYLTSIQQEKLMSHHSVFQEKICEFGRNDDLKSLKVFLNQKRLWSATCFTNLIRAALSYKSYRVLCYLRHVSGLYLTFRERENLVIDLFGMPIDMNIRWILNNFDENFEVPLIHNEADFLNLIQAHSRFPELLWAFRANYKKFPESAQFQYLLAIYRAHRDTLFEYRDAPMPFYRTSTRYSWVLYNIAVRYKANCCHVMARSLPYVVMNEFDPIDARLGIQSLIMEYVNSCPNCRGSHMWDAVLLSIQEQDIRFLTYLLENFHLKSKPPVTTTELTRLILKLDRRDEIIQVFDKCCGWKESKKLRKQYDCEIRKSQRKIRFWSFLLA